jgi:hypothetical protein
MAVGVMPSARERAAQTPLWDLWLLDRDDQVVAHLDDAVPWRYERRRNQATTATATLPVGSANLALARAPGARLSVRVRYLDASGAWVAREDWGGDLLGEDLHQTPDGRPADRVTLTAYHWQHWLRGARVIPAPAQEHVNLTMTHADDAMKHAVRVSLTAPSDPQRRSHPGLACAGDVGAAPASGYSARFEVLYDVVTSLAGQGGVSFDIVRVGAVGANAWEFRTYYPLQGTDRSLGGADHLTFSVDVQNLAQARYRRDGSQIINALYVGGPGEGVARTVELFTAPLSLALYGWREGFLDARGADTQAKRQAAATGYLAEHAYPEQSFEATLPGAGGALYARDWDLGDRVQVHLRDLGLTLTQDITAVVVAEEGQGAAPVVTPTFGFTRTLLDRLAATRQAVQLFATR